MRVLLVNTSEQSGGAAIAASRLSAALNRFGVEARLLVRDKQSALATTVALPQRCRLRGAFLWERLCLWAANGFSRKGLWSVDIANAGVDISRHPAFREADVIHLHWVNQGLLSMRTLDGILHSGKPVVWTLHDMWPVTGICHHAADCRHYHSCCHDCPQLQRPGASDWSATVFGQKVKAYAGAPLTFVAVSRWMAERARESALTAGHEVATIPNTLPLGAFEALPRQEARRRLGLPAAARVVAFGAARIDNAMKGLPRLMAALGRLASTPGAAPLHLLLFGGVKDAALLRQAPCPTTYLGPVAGPEALSGVYSASDVLVNSSDYETFGQTIIEAMACGCTPVSFDRGGQTDIISHRIDGYLARFGDIDDLACGIRWALEARLPADVLRQSVASRYSEEAVARQHIQLYERLLGQTGRGSHQLKEEYTHD